MSVGQASSSERPLVQRYLARLIRRAVARSLVLVGETERRARTSALPWRIIRYQRVTVPENHPYPISLSQYIRPRTLDLHFNYFRRHCNVRPLMDLLQDISSGAEISPQTVSLTFDDGWIDHFEFVFPLLIKHDLTATFFVPTGFVGSYNLFWPDKVMAALITLHDHGKFISSLPFVHDLFPDLLSEQPETMPDTIEKSAEIINRLRRVPDSERSDVITFLGLAINSIGGLPAQRTFLDWEEIQEMHAAGMSFGLQGFSHRSFDEMMREEIAVDLRHAHLDLLDHGIEAVPVVGYPQGDFTKEARETLGSIGLRYSLAIGDFPLPQKMSDKQVLLLGRRALWQEVSYCKELLACRLWVEKAGAFQF